MKSRYLYYRPKVDQMAPTKGIIFLLDLQEDRVQGCGVTVEGIEFRLWAVGCRV